MSQTCDLACFLHYPAIELVPLLRHGEEGVIVITLLVTGLSQPISQRSTVVYSVTELPVSSPLSVSVLTIWLANNAVVVWRSWGGVEPDWELASFPTAA
jgi:hypothetical protein